MFNGAFKGKVVFLTGHTGFKGSWLSEWLLLLGAEVYGFSLPPPTRPALFQQLGLARRLHHSIGDVRDPAAVRRSIMRVRPDFVFHLAAQPLVREAYRQPLETWRTNVMGTVAVLDALRDLRRPCAAVVVTTDKCYENREWCHGYREEDPLGGHDPYSSSKAAAEIAVAAWRRSFLGDGPVRVATARAGNVIGGGDWAPHRIVPDAIRALATGKAIPVRNPGATRPWQHVLEPLSGYLWLAACLASDLGPRRALATNVGAPPPRATRGKSDLRLPSSDLLRQSSVFSPLSSDLASAFNFGPDGNSNRTVRDLVEEMLRHWPGRWNDRSDPKAPHEANFLHLAIDKARQQLGWRPVLDFEATVERTLAWYRQTARSRVPARVRDLTIAQILDYAGEAAREGVAWACMRRRPGARRV